MLPPNPHSRQSSYVYPRQASFISRSGRSVGRGSEVDEDEEEEEELEMEMEMMEENARGLEETLEKLGFGAYHWRLLALCGFGWMSDNSALNCIALILPRVQVHFDLSSKVVGLLSASTMAGMMIGAVAWGMISDLVGRALPFNSTLFLTAVFGIGASFAPSFPILCVWMFLLGSAVGGSMPTDGTLFLENLPHSKQYLLTLLSVFFSIGAVLSSVISLILLPGASCAQFEGCDIEGKANDGWRRVLFCLGMINLVCSFARMVLFRLHESPRYLVSTGRETEALHVLRAIATYNDHFIDIDCADVQDQTGDKVHQSTQSSPCDDSPASPGLKSSLSHTSGTIPGKTNHDRSGGASPVLGETALSRSGASSRSGYDALGIGNPVIPEPHRFPIRQGSAFYTSDQLASSGTANTFDRSFGAHAAQVEENVGLVDGHTSKDEASVGAESHADEVRTMSWLGSWQNQFGKLFVPQWRRTVLLMWVIWGSMSFSYTMFNVWLPAVLESRASESGSEAIRKSLNEFVLYSVAGCPGSIIGAWMIQTRLGRRRSLAICTLATSFATFAFIRVREEWAVIVSSMIIAVAATAMYAVLYGMTPETFGTTIRGTACGTAAALSRLTGTIAPVSAGVLISITPSLPLITSAGIFVLAAVCALALPFERVGDRKSGSAGIMH